MISKQDIENWFTYHDDPNKVPRYKAIREAAKYLAGIIVDNTPESADQSAAIRLLRESVHTANAAIACEQPTLLAGMTGTPGIAKAATWGSRGDGWNKDAEVDPRTPHGYILMLERQLKAAQDQLRQAGGVPIYDPSR